MLQLTEELNFSSSFVYLSAEFRCLSEKQMESMVEMNGILAAPS